MVCENNLPAVVEIPYDGLLLHGVKREREGKRAKMKGELKRRSTGSRIRAAQRNFS